MFSIKLYTKNLRSTNQLCRDIIDLPFELIIRGKNGFFNKNYDFTITQIRLIKDERKIYHIDDKITIEYDNLRVELGNIMESEENQLKWNCYLDFSVDNFDTIELPLELNEKVPYDIDLRIKEDDVKVIYEKTNDKSFKGEMKKDIIYELPFSFKNNTTDKEFFYLESFMSIDTIGKEINYYLLETFDDSFKDNIEDKLDELVKKYTFSSKQRHDKGLFLNNINNIEFYY